MAKLCPTCKVRKLHKYSGFVELTTVGLNPDDALITSTKVVGYVCLKCGVAFFRTKPSEDDAVYARVSLKRIA